MTISPTGKRKQLSGAAKRKLKREREAPVVPPEDDEFELGGDELNGNEPGDVEAFKQVGHPPLDELNESLRWARKLLMVVTYQVATSKKSKLSEKRYAISDMVAKLGMTHAKSLIDEDLSVIEKRIGRGSSRKTKAHAVSTAGIAKPATARATRSNRGRKPVRGHVPDPAPRKDPGDDPLGGR